MKARKPKTLQDKIDEATRGMRCPVHGKEPVIKVNMEEADVVIEGCCIFFKKDVKVVVDRVIRAWNLHGEHLRARREGTEIKKKR
jgi:hypothetical protein